MPYGTLLIVILALPFVGSCLAVLLRANARNAEAWLAGAICSIDLVLVVGGLPPRRRLAG